MSYPLPRNVRYDRRAGTIVVEFSNGSAFVVPARALQGLADASETEIAEVELRGRSGLHWKSLDLDHEINRLMNGVLDCPVRPGLARTEDKRPDRVESVAWVGPVIAFLAGHLPGSREHGWDHQFITAYQVACEALVALGQADESTHGAVPRESPVLPEILPRWDDVAVAVIYLAAQEGLITFLASANVDETSLLGLRPESRHQADRVAWAARADPEVTAVFRLLGLLDGLEWSTAAETILWRDNPFEWRIDFTKDLRFIDAVEHACEYMPGDIREKMDRLAEINDADIAAHSSGSADQDDEVAGQSWIRLPAKSSEEVRATIHWIRRHDLDELFYRFWRIDDGWLTVDEAKRALEIFNDPLAIAMRKAVATRLYPHLPSLAE